ncbi:hypothetical protein [Brassicibacter mesophilus]|uniref:hypothetical protein n=1 Tax=Brassicibacter mesophilus TaxID=745119 RepID=UPI003D25F694
MKKSWIFLCVGLIIGLVTGVVIGSELFGTVKQDGENSYTLNNIGSFETIEEFEAVYPNVVIPDTLSRYKLDQLIVTEDPITNASQSFIKEVESKLEWEHDLSLIDYLGISYQSQNDEAIKINYKEKSKSFIPQIKDYDLDKTQIGDMTYYIYHDDTNIRFITFEKELWGKEYNVLVELLKTETDGSVTKQFELYQDKGDLIEFLESLSLNNLIKER